LKEEDQKEQALINVPGDKLDEAASEILKGSLGRAVDGFSGTISTVWGGLIGDRLGEWRTRNLISSLQKTHQLMKEKGIDTKNCRPLPNGELYTIFEGASKQDNPDLQKIWASLLANSLNPKGKQFRKEYARIIGELEPLDARFFTFVVKVERFKTAYDKHHPNVPNDIFMQDTSPEAEANRDVWKRFNEKREEGIREAFATTNMNEDECRQACGRLLRLSLLRHSKELKTHYFKNMANIENMIEGLEQVAKTVNETHAGEIKIHIFNAMRPDLREPNFTPTSFGWELAEICIA